MTLRQLIAIEKVADPWDLDTYIKHAMIYWHKMFWDHDAQWCIHTVGPAEIDFRFSILHPHTGFQQFLEGISKLKQVTGREHWDIQCY